MARKKSPEKPANHERWLVSYGDFITLLFAVFVTLYAMSQTDKKKVEQVASSYRSAFGVTSGAASSDTNIMKSNELMSIPSLDAQSMQAAKAKRAAAKAEGKRKAADLLKRTHAKAGEFQKIRTSIKVFLKHYRIEDEVTVENTSKGLVIRLEEASFFDPGSAEVKPEAYAILGRIASAISPYDNPIRVEGYTDDTPVTTNLYRSNWELSSSRAANIVHVFLDNYDILPENISIAGYGEYHPLADNSTEEGRKRNRRVDIVLLEANSEAGAP
jgi:chemotaxis protein MotB